MFKLCKYTTNGGESWNPGVEIAEEGSSRYILYRNTNGELRQKWLDRSDVAYDDIPLGMVRESLDLLEDASKEVNTIYNNLVDNGLDSYDKKAMREIVLNKILHSDKEVSEKVKDIMTVL